MYTTLKNVLAEASQLTMAVGAFNTHNLEMTQAIIKAASNQKTPVIIQTSEGTAQYVGMKTLVAVVSSLAKEFGVNVVLHLDHAKNWDIIREAVDAGYTSVMFDGSSLPFKDNILGTKRVVEYAHAAGVSVEAELGTVGGTEDGIVVNPDAVRLTEPEDAAEFIDKTNIDALAVAIGTNHGQYKSKTNINFDVLDSIHAAVEAPLVIHGGTGVSDDDIHHVINSGIRKFNVGTELLVNWNRKSKELYGINKENTSNRNNVVPALEIVQEIVEHKISLFKNID
ncbi:MAG: class II fructose-bisphosphate aldolase [Atopobium sp.]|uniref:class II fructose-bisphosphate aldolase n=1 Tax=Atopobium sp. TaxID=1872650 RepID=UPI002A748729|nr:class II fructose-bisphosphate aldolase [Atopobium sp.]MDY2787983.1 class II fructose-bisphosphate aldolase [Atopobium sp.]MDY4523362.1 class II fructose-bisphosphate aldolase [Atopobium sp.]